MTETVQEPDVEDDFEGWEDWEDEEEDDRWPESDHCKWIADGSETLEEVIECFEGFTLYLKDNLAAGFQLSQPVDGGWICYNRDTEGNPYP